MNLDLVERVGQSLRVRGWTVCTAESCTGGLIAAWLTEIAGSSDYVLGGVVSYANTIKLALLGVGEETLRLHGAVSPETAAEMALGAQERFGADLAVSVTEIAGPGGGTPDKPVGLTYIGLAGRGGIITVERHVWPGERRSVREASATRALELILQAANEAHS